MTVPVRGFAISTLHAYAEEGIMGPDDRADPDMADLVLVVDAYQRGGPYPTGGAPRRLVFDRADADGLAYGLGDLANTEDDEADGRRARGDYEGARYARAAQAGLSSLALRVRRMGRR